MAVHGAPKSTEAEAARHSPTSTAFPWLKQVPDIVQMQGKGTKMGTSVRGHGLGGTPGVINYNPIDNLLRNSNNLSNSERTVKLS